MNLEIIAGLLAESNELHRADQKWREERCDVVYQTPIVGQLAAGSVTLDEATQLAPIPGYCWSVRRLTVTGFTAGSVTVYMNAIEPVAPFPNPAVNTYGRGELLLQPKDRLVVVGAGTSGTAQLWGVADVFPIWYLKEYLS